MTICLAVVISVLAVSERRVAVQSKFFTEIGMPARFLARQAAAIFPGVASRLNGVNDSRVARAAAKMPRKSLFDSFAVIRAALLQHRRRTDHDPGDAEAALNSTLMDERLAQHFSHFFRNALEGNYVVAFHLFGFAQARQDRPSVNQDCATPASALRSATVFRRNDATRLAQNFQEVHALFVG